MPVIIYIYSTNSLTNFAADKYVTVLLLCYSTVSEWSCE